MRQNMYIEAEYRVTERCSEPCQTSKIKLFLKIVITDESASIFLQKNR